jgi:DNA-binding NarL/FixJ family response regulator
VLFQRTMAASRPNSSASARLTRGGGTNVVVLVGGKQDWPTDLRASLQDDGYVADDVADLFLVPALLEDRRVRALFVVARPLVASELLVLRRVREAAPRTAIVVVTRTATDPDLKRAFESGATAFLSWPASPDALRHAVESGDPTE